MDSSDESGGLKCLFNRAEQTASRLDSLGPSSSPQFQSAVQTALGLFRKASETAESAGLFSPNEAVDDVATADLPFFLLDFRTGCLVEKSASSSSSARLANLNEAETLFSAFLRRLDQYEMLTKDDERLWEAYQHKSADFTVAAGAADAAAKRMTKIARFKQEKELKETLKALQADPNLSQDDDIRRKLYLAGIALAVHETFQSLESLQMELKMVAFSRSDAGMAITAEIDNRNRDQRWQGSAAGLSDPQDRTLATDELGSSSSNWQKSGPFLDKTGKVLRPVTILGNDRDRAQMTKNVFRPGHNLPTMTIDEYLEEERLRGGIIEGGGPESGKKPYVDEDDYEKADEATMKARHWDDFKEANPRGSGNTINRG